jgi:DNA invertase Pin-like site-specific DNA recombinase
MTNQRPPQIMRNHLNRLAVVYVRQSTLRQVRENSGSTDYQRSQTAYALRWGWPEDRIEVYADLGLSGTRIEGREAFQQVLKLVGEGKVGIVLCADISRLGRALLAIEALVALCRRHGTLLVIDGQVLDFNDPVLRLLARLSRIVAEIDNEQGGEA